MDTKELLALLTREGFNTVSYRIESVDGGEGQDDCYCLRGSGSSWEVCYLERGVGRTLATFETEAAACDDFFARLAREPTSRSHLLTWFSDRSKADDFVDTLLRAGIKPAHRDAPAFAHKADIRHRIFVDGRDLERARRIRDGLSGEKAGLQAVIRAPAGMPEHTRSLLSRATAVGILLALAAGVSSCGDGCVNEILTEYPSPDRMWRVVVFQRDCGATTAFSTQASLIPITEELPNESGNVLVADSDHGAAPSGPGGGPQVDVEWESRDHIVISHHPNARVFKAEVSLSDITFRYRTSER